MSEDLSVEELEEFFKNTNLPNLVQIHRGIKISDVQLYVSSHLGILKLRGKQYGSYFQHLVELREFLIKEQQKDNG